MKGSLMSQLLACVLLLTMLLTTSAISAAGLTMRADLTHVDSGRGFTKWELATRMAARSRDRAASLHHLRGRGGGGGGGGHPATAPVAPGTNSEADYEYLIRFSIGTPQPQNVALTLDTGSNLVWTQCKDCSVCFDQPYPVFDFDRSASKTNYLVPCSDPICADDSNVAACYIDTHKCFYLQSYIAESITAGSIVRDTFTFKAPDGKGGTVVVPNITFGCGYFNKGKSGIAGFARGRQSLPKQLKVGKFSHCFTSMHKEAAKSSPVFLGTPDDLKAHATGPVQSTPMLINGGQPLYYLLFKGITVGTTRLPVDESEFALKGDGTGGTIIHSGMGITTFPQAVYDHLATAFASQMDRPVVNASEVADKLCFSLPEGADDWWPVSKLVFHLAGADMELPRENYVLTDPDLSIMCLMINGWDGDMTIIGNYQQQNMHIVYDVTNNKLLFAPAQCDNL